MNGIIGFQGHFTEKLHICHYCMWHMIEIKIMLEVTFKQIYVYRTTKVVNISFSQK
jgi:hypothetical protein